VRLSCGLRLHHLQHGGGWPWWGGRPLQRGEQDLCFPEMLVDIGASGQGSGIAASKAVWGERNGRTRLFDGRRGRWLARVVSEARRHMHAGRAAGATPPHSPRAGRRDCRRTPGNVRPSSHDCRRKCVGEDRRRRCRTTSPCSRVVTVPGIAAAAGVVWSGDQLSSGRAGASPIWRGVTGHLQQEAVGDTRGPPRDPGRHRTAPTPRGCSACGAGPRGVR